MSLRWHEFIFIRRCDSANQFAFTGLTRNDCMCSPLVRKGSLLRVQTQAIGPSFSLFRVRSMALVAQVRKNRTNVTIEVDGIGCAERVSRYQGHSNHHVDPSCAIHVTKFNRNWSSDKGTKGTEETLATKGSIRHWRPCCPLAPLQPITDCTSPIAH